MFLSRSVPTAVQQARKKSLFVMDHSPRIGIPPLLRNLFHFASASLCLFQNLSRLLSFYSRAISSLSRWSSSLSFQSSKLTTFVKRIYHNRKKAKRVAECTPSGKMGSPETPFLKEAKRLWRLLHPFFPSAGADREAANP